MTSAGGSLSFFLLLLGAIVAAGLADAALLVSGFRGRRVNDHPVCRKCRFDLSGVVRVVGAAPASITRCPECGNWLNSPATIRIGERAKRPMAIAIGVLLLLLSMSTVASIASLAFSSPANRSSKPTWTMRALARYGNATVAAPALQELKLRILDGTRLSKSEIESLVDIALEIQADQAAEWLPEWGDLVIAATLAGTIDASKFFRYVQNSIRLDVECREIVRAGEQVPAKLTLSGARSHTSPSLFVIRVGETEVSVGEEPPTVASNVAMMDLTFGGSGAVGLRTPTPTKLGPKRMKFRVQMDVCQNFQSTGTADPALTWTLERTKEVEVVKNDQPVVEVVRDDQLAERIRAVFKLRDVRIDPDASIFPAKQAFGGVRENSMNVMIDYGALPVPISFEIILHAVGVPPHDELLGEISLPAGAGGSYGLGGNLKGLPTGKLQSVHIILRPSLAVAERDASVRKAWLGPDLEFPDIPVLDQRGPGELTPE